MPGNYGIYLRSHRPKSKKAINDFIQRVYSTDDEDKSFTLSQIRLEDTSYLNPGYDGPLSDAPKTEKGYTFVGPDPRTDRRFYGNLVWIPRHNKWRVV